jgi:RNA polymerase sigma factor (sigma-70 family)
VASRHTSGAALKSIQALLTTGTLSGLTDQELLERFTSSDPDTAELAFSALVDRHGPMVLRVCRSILRDPHAADDAFQATFLIVALKASSIQGRDRFSSWLHSVAYNVAATARSSAARRRQHEQKAGAQRPSTVTESPADEISAIIHQELGKLPDRERNLLVLCYLEGQTQPQAAQRLGLPLGTVQSRLARARARLRTRLIRRGLAPALAVETLLIGSASTQAAVPAALANATVRLSLTIGASRLLAIGGAPLTVTSLAQGVARTMFVTKALKSIAAAVLLTAGLGATGAVVHAYQSARPEPAAPMSKPNQTPNEPRPPQSDAGELTVTGIVRMPNNTPVPGAIVKLMPERYEAPRTIITDAAGRFQFQGIFSIDCRLHATSADGTRQGVLSVPATEARTALRTPRELTLFPALNHQVTVLKEGRPVTGVHVLAMGPDFRINGMIGPDGKVKLKLPAKASLYRVVAWHPTQGIAGIGNYTDRIREGTTQLSLLPPARHTIRALDSEGKPVSGLELCVGAKLENADWITSMDIEASHVRTNSSGIAIVPWLPRQELERIQVEPTPSDWKLDDTDLKQLKQKITTIRVRQLQTVQGRLIMPEGASAEGILISGFAFGPADTGYRPSARARRDGTFAIKVPSAHAFVLGVSDNYWASDPWSGTTFVTDTSKPAEITIKVYPATQLIVRVTRGPESGPLAKASVEAQSQGRVSWTDQDGKKRNGIAGPAAWLNTDDQGIARVGVGKGTQKLFLMDGLWIEERKVEVKDDKPIEVHFHRAWKGDQKITGRITLDGAPHIPSPSLLTRVWAQRSPWMPPTFEPTVNADGTFEVTFDAESVSLFFWDRDKKCAGILKSVKGGATPEVILDPTASYSGKFVDEQGRALPGQTIQLYLKTADNKPIAAEQTDAEGRFHFSTVPANVPLQFTNKYDPAGPECYIANGDRLFKPGENRENDQLVLHKTRR